MAACIPFQGTRVGAWGSAAVRLSETRYDRRHRIAKHAHAGVTVAFVLTGGFVERQGSRAIECGPATLLLRPPSMEHEDRFVEGGGRCFNIELSEDLVAERTLSAIDCSGGPAVWAARRLVADAHDGVRRDGLAVESDVADLVNALCPSEPQRASVVAQRMARRLRERFAEPWSLAALAREAELHPMHLARVFRAAHGESIGEYVQRLRVEYAARELARTESPIATIAADAGFADQAHLTRVFRRHTRATPARFRATFRENALRSFKTSAPA